VRKLTIDSSVIISSLLKNEPRHKEALVIWEDVLKGKCFVILDDKSAIEAAEIAAKTGLRGMDALVVQVAREYGAELISFDKEMIKKAKVILKNVGKFRNIHR